MSQSPVRRSLAVILAVSVAVLATPASWAAPEGSSLTGRVLAENGATARKGVVVALVNTAASSESVYRSKPTDARGGFRVEAPAAGHYAIVVEAPEGAFLASGGLDLAAGENKPVALALKPGKQGQGDPPPAPPAGSTPPPASAGLPTWAKWVIAGGIVVGAAIVVDAVASDDDEASSF